MVEPEYSSDEEESVQTARKPPQLDTSDDSTDARITSLLTKFDFCLRQGFAFIGVG